MRRAGACCVPHSPAPDLAVGLFPGEMQSGSIQSPRTGLELLTGLVLHLQLTGPFNDKCELGTSTDVGGISERAAQVE